MVILSVNTNNRGARNSHSQQFPNMVDARAGMDWRVADYLNRGFKTVETYDDGKSVYQTLEKRDEMVRFELNTY